MSMYSLSIKTHKTKHETEVGVMAQVYNPRTWEVIVKISEF